MKKSISYIIFLLLTTTSLWAQNAVEFVENQGQWTEDFAYKASTSGGDIYLQKGAYTINIAASQNSDKVHAFKHGEISTPPTLKYHAYQVDFVGANDEHGFTKGKVQSHYYNYFLGNDPSHWKSNIHPSLSVDYSDLYENIDAHIYSDQGKIKYDFVVKPGAKTKNIQMQYKGVENLHIEDEHLIMNTSLGEMKEVKPYAYQFINGEKVEVTCNFQIKGKNKDIVSFKLPKGYDKKYELIIDPVLIFCSFSGSTGDNWGTSATYDQYGNYYGGGFNLATGFPATTGAYDVSWNGGNIAVNNLLQDVSILKFNSAGSNLIYATYIGGALHNEQPHSLIVDTTTGNLIIAGRTYSSDFPVSGNAYDQTLNGSSDLFVFVLDSTGGNMIGSTFMGGSADDGVNISPAFNTITGLKHNYGDDARSEVNIDNAANIYVAAMTRSNNFPTTPNAFQASLGGQQDGVIFELSPDCSNLIWSTYAGGTSDDACYVLSFDKQDPNRLYVAGGTASSNFPTTAGTLNSSLQGGIDGFLMRINATTKTLDASTFIGTNTYDQVYGVQTDDSNHVFIMGQTQGAYPVTAGVYTNPNSPQFITKLDANLSNILVSTVFGTGSLATTNISPTAFLIDRCGNIYVSGWGGPTGGNPGSTTGMPVSVAPATPLKATTDGSDFYYIALNRNMVSLQYATFFGLNSAVNGGEHVDGGTSRFDPNGVIYQAICAACQATPGFPTTPGAYATTNGSNNCNLGAVKIDFQLQDPDAEASANGNTRGCVPHAVTFSNTSVSATGYIWNFGDGSPTSTQNTPTHTYTTAGIYTVTLIAENPNGCTYISDTDQIVITVLDDSIQAGFTFAKVDSCNPFTATFNNTSTFNGGPINPWSTFFWDFGDGTTFTGANPPLHNFPAAQSYTVTLIMSDTMGCNSPDSAQIVIDFSTSVVLADFQLPDSVCLPANVSFTDQSSNPISWSWTFGDGGNSTAQNPSHTYVNSGQYTVKLVSENLTTCNLRDSIEKLIEVFPSPTAGFTYSPNPPEPNKPLDFTNQSVGATRYDWDFGDGTTSEEVNPTKIYERDGFYNVCLTATNEYGCKDSVCRRVRGYVVPLVDVPSGFSPNGDGYNDVVRVLGYGIETMTFKIFNRWGEKVFETTDRFTGWDGTYKGEAQEMDAYGYTLDVTFFDNTRTFKKGNITLLR